MMAKYNGHRSWAQWNVSLWINNDYGLYSMARDCVRRAHTRDGAARTFLGCVGADRTPDGARYSRTAVINAMRGMR